MKWGGGDPSIKWSYQCSMNDMNDYASYSLNGYSMLWFQNGCSDPIRVTVLLT